MSLAICTVVENPLGWKSRYKNYHRFARMVADSGGTLYTVEIAYKDQAHQVTVANNPHYLQLRTECEMWHKENALNLLFQRTTEDCVAWIDADVAFADDMWIYNTLKLLEKYDFVQMFSSMLDLDSQHHPAVAPHDGFVYQWKKNNRVYGTTRDVRTGNAWAARKESLTKVGGLIDWGIVGCGDHHMASALVGNVFGSLKGMAQECDYRKKCDQWEEKALQHIKLNISYLPGLLLHYFHGESKKRKYLTKLKALNDTSYCPDLDLTRDWQGLYQLNGNNITLRDFLRDFFRERDDDGLEANRIFP